MARTRLTLVALILLLTAGGCATVTVRRFDGPPVDVTAGRSALIGPGVGVRTMQTLRQQGLAHFYPGYLAEAVGKLHTTAMADPQPEFLFALAELNYLRGLQIEKKNRAEAASYYYLAAGYAYHYLFDTPPPVRDDIRRVALVPAPALATTEVFDPRFRMACDLYNAGVSKLITAAQEAGTLDTSKELVLHTERRDGAIRVPVVHQGFLYRPEEFGPVEICAAFEVKGLANVHRTFGLGVPLIGSRNEREKLPNKYYPARFNFPITAFFRFEGGLAELYDRRAGRLEFLNPKRMQTVQVVGRPVPLETDLTTPLAFTLANTDLGSAGLRAFLRPDSVKDRVGLYMLEPFDPAKIPVIFVHGLLSSPDTWAPMVNDLQADPAIRERYQFWVYFYPTSQPYFATAADLRKDLREARAAVDPQETAAASDEKVLVGHSMGGLVSRLMTVSSGDAFFKLLSDEPFDSLSLKADNREKLRRIFFWEPSPSVKRVVFLATPHRGSKLSPSLIGRIGANLARLPSQLVELSRDLVEDNSAIGPLFRRRRFPNSVDLLAPDAPALETLATRPKNPAVRYHSVVGVTDPRPCSIDALLGTGERGDGVVPYYSAHLDAAESEVVVDAEHGRVHQHPLAILEVRRILYEHARILDRRAKPLAPADVPRPALPTRPPFVPPMPPAFPALPASVPSPKAAP